MSRAAYEVGVDRRQARLSGGVLLPERTRVLRKAPEEDKA